MPPPTALSGASSPPAIAGRRRTVLFAVAVIMLVAVNLRIAITSLGALLDEVRDGLGLAGWQAGLVTTLPGLAFAAVGPVTPWLSRRLSPDRIMVLAMVLLGAGQALRAVVDSPAVFIATTGLALSGIAVANVLLPALVKERFPQRVGLVTGAYSVCLVTGATLGAATAVPIAHAAGSWRVGLGAWAVLAILGVLPVLPGALRRWRPQPVDHAAGAGRIQPARTRLGWAMAVNFGTQALSGYALMGWLAQLFRDAGFSPQAAGLLLAGVTVFGMPIALGMAPLAVRLPTLRPIVLTMSAAATLGYLGLAVAPRTGAVLWVALLAIGQGGFPMILAAIGMRARTATGTVALSAFTQSAGYLVAGIGPLVVGLLYEATGGWTVPLGFLLLALVGQTISGLAIARPRFVEDERVRTSR